MAAAVAPAPAGPGPRDSAAALRRPRRGAKAASDVSLSDPDFGSAIATCLRIKGFCVIDDVIDEGTRKNAIDSINADVVEFFQPAPPVQEGLLGAEGSNRIALASSGDGLASPGLSQVDTALTQLTNAVGAHQYEVGFRCASTTGVVLHEVREPSIEEADLTDQQANEWYAVFLTRKIMVLVCLGPERGDLELVPFDEDANPIDLGIGPGMAVVLRTDQMTFGYSTRGSRASFVATSFMLQGDIANMHQVRTEQHTTPAAAELRLYIEKRLQDIKLGKAEELDVAEANQDVPRNFISAANRTYFTKTQTAVRGYAARLPSTWNPEVFFLATLEGVDVVQSVPLVRWNHDDGWYDPQPDSFTRGKTSCRHASFAEGIDLFDNKMFGLSIAEVKGMDPSQRQVLECTYEALWKSGMKKSTLNNASCGMYVGMGTTEWNNAERSADVGIFGATGGSPSICAGRLSFCLGCKGASLAIDTEAASGLSCVYFASESVEKKGPGYVQELACAIGVNLVMAGAWWPAMSASGFLSPGGRCFSFDASADGHVRGEATGVAVVRAKPDNFVDGERVKDDLPLAGTITGAHTMNSGKSAGLTAPSGPAEVVLLSEACRASDILLSDVDVMECHAAGRFLADASEVISARQTLRASGDDAPLVLGSHKTSMGNSIEASGLVSLGRMMYQIRWGMFVGSQHLYTLNPHIHDKDDAPAIMHTETLEPRQQSTFGGVSSHGFAGTMVHVQLFGGVDEEVRRPPEPTPEEMKPKLAYWPSGGGSLEHAHRPRKGFFISGTFNSWAPELMKDEGEGRHGFVMTLGENSWEQFQIWLDGDSSRILHPPFYKAPKGVEVCGPSENSEVGRGATWLIDARSGAAPAAIGDGPGSGAAERPLGGPDAGRPGDRYHICVHTAGKWRTVAWSKCADAAPAGVPPPGQYFFVGSANAWTPQPMDAVASTPGLFTFEVKLPAGGCQFQVHRNEDWTQAFFPAAADAGPGGPVLGPDDAEDACWSITGQKGEVFRVEFQRSVDEHSDATKVSWRRKD